MVVAVDSDRPRVEGHAVVLIDDGLAVPGDAVAFLDFARHALDLEAVVLAHPQLTADFNEGAVEERLDVVGLEAGRFNALHLASHVVDLDVAHGRRHKLVRPQQFGDALGDPRVHHLGQVALTLRPVGLPDRRDHQVAERVALEQLAENVVDAPAERRPLFLELLKQARVDIAFARVVGDKGPHEAGVGLTDAVDTPEPLLDAVRVPRQVVVDQQVGVLVEVDTLACCVGRDQEDAALVLLERLLGLLAVLALSAAVDRNHSVVSAEMLRQAHHQIVKGVPVLREDDHLASGAGVVSHLVGVVERVAQRVPLRVRGRCLHGSGLQQQPFDDADLGLELLRRARVRRSGDGLVFQCLTFLVGEVFEVVPIIGYVGGIRLHGRVHPRFAQLGLQPRLAAFERAVDRGRRRCQSALQRREREPNRSSAAVVALDRVGPVHLLADVVGDGDVDLGYSRRSD